MRASKRILSTLVCAVMLLTALCGQASAADYGTATIGFSTGDIYYMPYGLSSVPWMLDLEFGTHRIDTSTPTIGYSSLNYAGYTINNESGGFSGYRVMLGLSGFDNGLEGTTMLIRPGSLQTNNSLANNPPIFPSRDSAGYVHLDSDGSSVVMLEATSRDVDPSHTATGIWGFEFDAALQVYTATIRPGKSRAVMTWDIVIA